MGIELALKIKFSPAGWAAMGRIKQLNELARLERIAQIIVQAEKLAQLLDQL